jgi:hypothetical protein
MRRSCEPVADRPQLGVDRVDRCVVILDTQDAWSKLLAARKQRRASSDHRRPCNGSTISRDVRCAGVSFIAGRSPSARRRIIRRHRLGRRRFGRCGVMRERLPGVAL